MVTCGSCGNEELEASRFCGSCGAPIVQAEQPAADTAVNSAKTLICPSCGNEEPEGARYCGSCSAPLSPAERPAAPAVSLTAETPRVDSPSSVEPPPTPPAAGKRRTRWIAVGALVVLLVAGGAFAAVLLRDDGGEDEAVTTEQQPPPTVTSESPPTSSPTLADTVAPRLELLSESQAALIAQVRLLGPGVASLAALRQKAEALAADLVETQRAIDGLAPADSTEAGALELLRPALETHLAYAEAVARFPARPRSVTRAQAQEAITLAEQARRAYVNLVVAFPALPVVYMSGSDNNALLAVVPAPKPAPSPLVRRTIDLVPLLVGVRPDDPLGEGRCFGAYTSRASLRVSGVVHRSGFVQCGDDANGDPGRASGTYRFSGSAGPSGSRPIRLTGQVAIDESSSPSQRGSSVTWTAVYAGRQICSATVVWSGARPSPRTLDCRIPPGVDPGGFDVRRLRIQQVASLASSGSLWAGLLDPRIVVQGPG